MHEIKMAKRNIFEFNVQGSVHPKNILIYIQQDARLHSLFYIHLPFMCPCIVRIF